MKRSEPAPIISASSEIPDGWKLKRLKWSVASAKNGIWGSDPAGNADDIGCIRVADFDRVNMSVTDVPTIRNVSSNDRNGRVVLPGDLLLEKSGGGETQPVGAVAMYLGREPAVCSNFIARLAVSPGVDARFFLYVHAALYYSRINIRSIKQTSGIQNLDASAYLSEFVAYPPLETQRKIADFLGRETTEADVLVAQYERLIELLEEKRIALIAHAVTKGIDPNVPMKDSGVEWVGIVPEHWTVVPLKQVATLKTGHTPSRHVAEYWENCMIPWVSLADVGALRDGSEDYVVDTKECISELGLANSAAELLPAKTVILSRTASVGFPAILARPMATTQDFVNWVCNENWISPQYLLQVFRAMKQEFARLTSGSVHQTIYMPDVASFKVPLPPLQEQREIATYLTTQVGAIFRTVELIRGALALVKERRSALIIAAVTGQIDVTNYRSAKRPIEVSA